jgi:hypothetical protein
VESLDANSIDVIDRLAYLQPEVVIMDSSQWRDSHSCSLNRLFEILPNLIVLEVNLNNSSVQLIRSGIYDASGFAGFLNVLDSVRTNLRDAFIPMPTMQPHE